MALSFGVFCSLMLYLGRDFLIDSLSSSPDVRVLVREGFLLIYVNVVFEFFARSCQGIIQGLGKQALGSLYTLFGYWIVGIPFSMVSVSYFNGGILSVWLGPLIALIINSILYYSLISKTDWNSSVEAA